VVIGLDWLKEIANNLLLEYDRLNILVDSGENKGYIFKAEEV